MKIVDNLKDFLMDQEYYIDIYDDKLHAYNYKKLLKINETIVELQFEKFVLEIRGNNIKIVEMNSMEIMIHGMIDNVRIKR